MQQQAENIVKSHTISSNGHIDISVSHDGTWKKRGFTSHHGIATAIECETGIVLDSDYLCTYIVYILFL